MVYINRSILLFLLAVLYGCGTTTATKDPVESTQGTAKNLPLVETVQYLPEQKINKKGEPVPYEAAENPYLKRGPAVKKVNLALFLASKRAFDQQQWVQAQGLLKDLVAQTNKLSGPWVMLGDVELELGNTQIAEENFLKAIKINKNNVNAYLRLAMVQRMLGNYTGSQRTYGQALSIWRDFPEAHLNLGVLYDVYLNNPAKGLQHMQAYQFLTDNKNEEVAAWVQEIEKRLGIKQDNSRPTLVGLPQDEPVSDE